MRLVAATRVLNEEDILEAFVRHHAGLVDHFLFLDNGSTDRSLAILRALQAEGLPLTVLQTRVAHFCEPPVLTALFQMAARLGADWVLMLDCDEFVDERATGVGLRGVLANLGPEQGVLGLPTVAYHPTPNDDADDLLVPRCIRWREKATQPGVKVVVRGQLIAQGISIGAGNHVVIRQGQYLDAVSAEGLVLAHYQHRSPWRQLAAAVIGRLKVVAAGQTVSDSNVAVQQNRTFEAIRDDPAALLRDPGFLSPDLSRDELIEDPIDYRGGDLQHTEPSDPVMRAIASVAAFGEALASQHARLLDTNEGVRLQLHNLSLTWTQVA
jgi:hypothetical protein